MAQPQTTGISRPVKAALYSGLICPGAGQLWLKHWLLGSLFTAISLVSLGWLCVYMYQQALLVVDQVLAGQVSNDFASLYEAVNTQIANAESNEIQWLTRIFIVNWLVSIISAYWLGRER